MLYIVPGKFTAARTLMQLWFPTSNMSNYSNYSNCMVHLHTGESSSAKHGFHRHLGTVHMCMHSAKVPVQAIQMVIQGAMV